MCFILRHTFKIPRRKNLKLLLFRHWTNLISLIVCGFRTRNQAGIVAHLNLDVSALDSGQ